VLPTVAMVTLLLTHAPPLVASDKVIVVVAQTLDGPEIGPGRGLTVTVLVDAQPDDRVYAINEVPGAIPATRPPVTVATDVALLLHVPPVVASVSGKVRPVHTCDKPTIAAGDALTVTPNVVKQPVDKV